MTRFVGTPLTGIEFASESSEAFSARVDEDTNPRIRIDAGGRITWSSGAAAGDTTLYRASADTLKTDDNLNVGAKLSVLASSGDEGGEISLARAQTNTTLAGAIIIDSYQNKIRFFEDGGTNRGAYIDLTACAGGAGTNLLTGGGGGATTLDELSDVVITSATSGQFLKFNGTNWVNSAIALGTDTTGNYMIDVSAGTGISVTHTQSEGSTATIGLNASLNDLSDVTIASPEEFQSLVYNGTSWVNQYASVVTYVRNAESTTLTTGTVVYLFGATGDHATVKRADNDADSTSSKTVGLVAANIAASQNGPVVTRGYVDGIDLSVGYTEGDILWLGEDGGFTKNKPSAPEHLVFIGVVVRATNNGIIYVATQNGYELDELHDVSITDRTSGDFLKYNGTLWINDQINLGTDTVGNYMVDVTAGTGVTVTHTPSEGSTATIAIGQAVGTSDSPTFSGLTINGASVVFEGATADDFETTLTVTDPTADRTITIPNITGTLVTTGDTGTVTSTMISDGTIVNGDINASAAISLSKLASGTSGQIVVANSSGVPTYTTVSGDITISDTGVAAIAANSVALGTDTTGDYVASLTAGANVTITGGTGEGSTPTIAAVSNFVAQTDAPANTNALWLDTDAVGLAGPAGPGVPSAGTTGQVLTKVSGTNYDTAWQTPSITNSMLSGIGTFTSFTPTLTATTTNPTLGTGSSRLGQYTRVGDTVTYFFAISFGTSGTAAGSGTYQISLPVTADVSSGIFNAYEGSVQLYDNSATTFNIGVAAIASTGDVLQIAYHGGGILGVTNSAPWTWAASDIIRGFIIYKAA